MYQQQPFRPSRQMRGHHSHLERCQEDRNLAMSSRRTGTLKCVNHHAICAVSWGRIRWDGGWVGHVFGEQEAYIRFCVAI